VSLWLLLSPRLVSQQNAKPLSPLLKRNAPHPHPRPLTQRSLSPGCDLNKTCFCRTDEHCAAGFKCVASKAFPQYTACKPAGLV